MIEVEILGARLIPDGLRLAEVRRLCVLATAAVGVEDGHLAIELVGVERIVQLNSEHRGKPVPTDVLSFPIDGVEPLDGVRTIDGTKDGGGVPRELGDVVICPEHTTDLREAVVHGVLHLLGMDHETDDGEMLTLQAELLLSREVANRGQDADPRGTVP
jgi:probable rRNA maturation factor